MHGGAEFLQAAAQERQPAYAIVGRPEQAASCLNNEEKARTKRPKPEPTA